MWFYLAWHQFHISLINHFESTIIVSSNVCLFSRELCICVFLMFESEFSSDDDDDDDEGHVSEWKYDPLCVSVHALDFFSRVS